MAGSDHYIHTCYPSVLNFKNQELSKEMLWTEGVAKWIMDNINII